ncbi:MAG: CHAD domain-containing protein [Chlorobiaceae bacterium]|nr:CHAD domain-containing protein [Chlorobiaceae bacterium]
MHTTHKMLFIKLNQAASREWLPENIFPPGLQLKTLSSWKERREFYDTFEWQAFEKGFVIVKKKKKLFLADLNSGHETFSLSLPGNPSSFFSDTLPSGDLKNALSSCTEIRAFIKLCSIDVIIHSYRILDDNEKTIATLTSESLYLADKEQPEPFIHLFSLLPFKGYEDEMKLIQKALSDDVGTVLDFRELFLLIMNAAGRNIHDYSSKIRLDLDADAPIYESARQLLQFTFSIMRANESGIKKNIDSEFLHDYRVAIRRTRSILKQLKGVFDSEETAYYLNLFRDLGKRTNELRDMDVYLLKQATYFHYLPSTLQPSLKLFFTDIAASRRRLHKQFCSYLESTAYQSFLEEWDAFANRLSIPDPERSPNATLFTKSIGVESIKKAWKKVVRHGRQISRETTDTELHALRIDCKKLRYLLEFFSSIFPQKTTLPVIRQLKELQDNLGDFVDFSVQHHFLQERLLSIPPGKEQNVLAASIGGLMATLFQKQEETRSKFHKTFRSFDHEETSQLFHDLLSTPK